MAYSTQDVKHFERLVEFFNGESFIEGEFPFYVDDRLLDEDNGTVTKNVYRNGKRTSKRMFPVSTNDEKGKHLLDLQTIKYWKPQKQYNNSFVNYVMNRWDSLLTNKQKKFLVGFINGDDKKYSRQLRYKYRTNIQRRLKKAFIGVGGDNVSVYMVAQYRRHIDLVNKFLEASYDNEEFELLLLKKINKDYVNEIIYCKLSSKARQNIVCFYFQRNEHLTITTLNEFFEHIMTDKERFERLGLI